ncbi:MAG TPA: lipid-A-disaccharide synthase N-terminal domain-containing protein [Terrimicrobiaceae bacterium]
MRSLRLLAPLLFCCATLCGESLDRIGRPVDDSVIPGSEIRFKVALSGAKDNVKAARLRDGSLVYIVKRLGSGTDRMLTPDEFSRFYYDQQTSQGWLSTVFNVTSPAGLAWVAIGLSGQLLFTGRMIIQWFASEKSKRSVVPVSFWWMSLVGATMLLVYFIWRRDIVGILGQATGWIIYVRNLVLIRRSRS